MDLQSAMTVKAAVETAGQVSNRNSKMPGTSFPISARVCQTGGKLAQVDGSVCSRCYALKLENMRPSVHMGWTANYLKATTMIAANPGKWSDAVAFQIDRAVAKGGEPFHRWFDSGDLQSVEMLAAIVMAAEKTPHVKHWLPTREAGYVKAFMASGGVIPANLVIRVSSTMVNDAPRAGYANTSTVHGKAGAPAGHVCPARHQGNACGQCRACWSRDVANVSYPLH